MDAAKISEGDKNLVQETWKKIYSDWDAGTGVNFYARLHAAHPAIKAYFDKLGPRTDEDKQKQAVRAGKMFQSWFENLHDKGTLSERIAVMAQSHKARGITNISLYEEFFDELIAFLGDTIGLSSSQQAAWKNITAYFLGEIKKDIS